MLALVPVTCGGERAQEGERKPTSRRASALETGAAFTFGTGWPFETVVALRRFDAGAKAKVKGDATVIAARGGSGAGASGEAVLGPGATLEGNLVAAAVRLKHGATVTGRVGANDLHSKGTIAGGTVDRLELPLTVLVPPFPR